MNAFFVAAVHGQSVYLVNKGQVFFQTASSGAVADPSTPFGFSVQAPTNVPVILPSGASQTLSAGGDIGFRLEQPFTTKTALDTAFPNGTYRMTVGSTNLSFNLTTDTYPAATPQVTNGTWNNGVLVIDATQPTTIAVSTFATYATAGVAGHMVLEVNGLSDSFNRKLEIATQAVFGLTAATNPFGSYTIQAGQFTNGRVYEGNLDFDTLTTLDTTSVPGSGAVAIFSKSTRFFIAAVANGTTPATPQAPVLANQTGPAGGSVTIGTNANFGQNAYIEWRKDGQRINFNGNTTKYSFNGSSLTINNLTSADAGSYSVMIVTTGGLVTSNAATLTIGPAQIPTAPTISAQPQSRTIATGSTVVFNVSATGVPNTFTYQWRKDGVNLANGVNGVSGATSATLMIQGANAATAGNYSVEVQNSAGTATSSAVALTVTTTSDPGRLINLSVLTDITGAVPDFTVGTVVGGANTSGNKALVVRAVGPSLGALGVPGTIADPQLTLFNSSSVAVVSNDNWGGDSTLLTTMASVGAFAYVNGSSKDAAVFQPSLAPGGYTVKVSGVAGATGTAIAEIYDATPAGTFTPSSSRLINVSVLKQISANGTLTLGFTIGGSTAKTVLVRVIGPGLAAVGVTSGTLGDPQLTLFNSTSTSIATNDDWAGDQQLNIASSRVNAFQVNNPQSKDAMLLTTLAPGGYTAQAKGNAGTSGLAIVEVYEIP